MKKNNKTEILVLRQKAEEQLKILKESAGADNAPDEYTAAETFKLIHELEVHQIELEIQKQELTLAKEQAIFDCEKYIELYDLAPTGYFTLSRDGEIIQLNISGAKMLGKARSQLISRLFHLFVSDNSKPFFLHFLEKVFDRHEKEICELTLPTNDDIPMYVYLTGIVSGNGSNCLITAVDITERKLLESSVVEKMILQSETEKAGKIGGWSFNVKTLIQNWTLETFNILEIDTMKGTPQVPEGIEFIDESFRQTAEIAIKRAIEFGEPFEQVWKVTTAKGNKRWVNVVGKTKIVKGKTIGLFGSIQDITERKLAEKHIERLNRVYSVLSNINKTIVRVRDRQLLFEDACCIAVEIGGFKMAWIGILNTATNKIDVVASSGKTGEYLNNINIDLNNEALNSGPAGMTIKTGKCNFSNNIQSDYRTFYWREKAREYGFQSIIALPVIVWGKTIGVYMIYSGEIDFFNEDEIKLLEEMASDISFAIEFIESENERKQAEQALLASELKYHTIFNNVQDVFYQTNLAGTVLEVSPSIKIFSEFNRDEIVGKPVTNLYYDPNDRIEILNLLKKKGQLRDYELTLKGKNGEIKYTSINARLIFDSEGKPNHIDGAIRDITERKLMQEKLSQSEERFQLAMKASKDGLFDWNLETNKVYYSPGWKKIIGYKDHELPNDISVWEKATEPLGVRKSYELHQKLISKEIARIVLEFKMKHKDGHWVDILSQAKAIFNKDGKAIRIVGTHTDISERKRTEESLMKLKTAIDKSEISVVITDRNGNIEYANPFFSKLTGYSPEEYIGKNSRILKSEYHPKEFYEEMWNTINSGETWEGEFYNCKKNGEMYWENAIISPIANSNNEITHFVAIKTDITHAKNITTELIIAKEHAEESDRLKSAFLANMSHEIRTPMNGILGFTELLKEPDLSDDQRKYYISIIEKSGKRLLNIINDIIDISKIESGLMKVQNSGINVNEYLDQILTFFNPEAEAKNIKLICKVGLPNKEAFLETDSEKFYAILINLVKNALKYTETGFVEFGYNRVVETHGRVSLPNHSYLQFYVKDTGIGIPKDRQEAIFERFVQADIVNKMARQGTGLGLSISRAYVEMLRGKIWVESVEGIGSTFYFTLPFFANPKEKAVVKNGIQAIVEGNMVGSLKILIAEDDETSSKLISIHVLKFGNEIITVQTGTEAVEACLNNPDIDLILMDIQMPEMSGYEATRQIRQFNSEVIIIALTAFALAGDREKSIEAGCNDYISKPIQKDELVEMIQKYFKK